MSEAPVSPAPPPAVPRVRGRRRRALGRWTRRGLLTGIAVLCGFVVTFVTVDIGRWFSIRERAEKFARGYMNDRPVHIGRVSAFLMPGSYAIDDLRIEGRNPGDRPFLTAKRVTCHVQWLPLLQKRVVLEVVMDNWHMLVEQFPDATTSMPRFGSQKPGRKLPVEIRASWFYAQHGEFQFEDHGTPWSVTAPNLNLAIVWADMFKKYVGTAKFSNGAVRILNFEPMRTDFAARISIAAGKPVQIEHIDLVTDGAVSRVSGEVDFSRWPEQHYDVESTVNFPRMREIFFPADSWRIAGDGHFKGVFHLFQGGRELTGGFTSSTAVLRLGEHDLPFPNLRGSLLWSRERFQVTDATAGFFGGTTAFRYSVAFGKPGGATATFATDYTGLDLAALGQLFHWRAVRIEGVANGHQAMTWTNGHLHDTLSGDGELVAEPASGAPLASATLPSPFRAPARQTDEIEKARRLGVVPVGGDAQYHLDARGLDFHDSWAATPSSYTGFEGRYEFDGGRLNMPVHVVSRDAQDSDRLLAAILTERGSTTGVIPVGGGFTFDGRLTETFATLRAEGRFDGDSIYAFANTWGHTSGDIVLQNGFVDVSKGVVTGAAPDSRIDLNGRFALGYRSQPAVEEMHGVFHIEKWPLADFKSAFTLTDWPIDGTGTADLNLKGPYKRLVGDGTLRVDNGVAWKEPFDVATGKLTFADGTGLGIVPLRIDKSGGTITGSASVNWVTNSYTFDVKGTRVRVETLKNFSSDKAKLSGVLSFQASGASTFAAPEYKFTGNIPDLFVADQGIGAVFGSLRVLNRNVDISQLTVISPLGQAEGHGNVMFDDAYTADLSLTVRDASIDPYFKFFTTATWFEHIGLIAGGSVRIRGPLSDIHALDVQASIDEAHLKLFDYELHNQAPFALGYQGKTLTIGRAGCADAARPECHIELMSVDGVETRLQLNGTASATDILLDAKGSASLAILRAFKGFGDVTSSGDATIDARLAGDYTDPHFSGRADIKNGTLKFPWLPRTVEHLTGPITMDATGINFDGLRGQMGDGTVQFGGLIGFRDYKPEDFDLTLSGTGVNLRGYPRGFDTTVDARLSLRGPFEAPLLGGDVDVRHVRLQTQIEPDVSLIALAAGGGSVSESGVATESSVVIRSDVHIHAVPMRLIDMHDLWITGGTDDLVIQGTIDKPIITGRIDVTGGQMFFNTNQFRIQPGSIDFSDPSKFDPSFNIVAETNSRAPGQTYHVTVRASGTLEKPQFVLTSEPWLPQNYIYALLLGGTPDVGKIEQSSLRSPQQYETQLMATLLSQMALARSGVGNIFEHAPLLPLDTVQFTPTMLASDLASVQSQTLNPSARLTLGKRISDRIYLIYSRDLTTSGTGINEFYLLQFDENDRLQWALSRNEDRSFALDFRFRHIF